MHLAAFLGGLAVFFAAHLFASVRSRGAGDIKVRAKGAYMAVFSLVSLAGFAAMAWGFAYLKPWHPAGFPVVDPPSWTRHAAMTLMLPAAILIVAAYAPAGRIKKAVKHPMLAAVKTWALAHLLANWDLASLILFGSFLAYGVFARIAAKRRGDDGAAGATPGLAGDLIASAGGIAVYGAIAFWLHPVLFGVSVTG